MAFAVCASAADASTVDHARSAGSAAVLAVASASTASNAVGESASTAAIAETQAWWHAFAIGDLAYLRDHTASQTVLTLASGASFDRDGLLAESASFTAGTSTRMEWGSQTVHFVSPDIAVVHSDLTETVGPNTSRYRFLTLLERSDGRWLVSGAQSTRIPSLSPRVSLAQAGVLMDFVGIYLTPKAGRLEVALRDGALVMVDPDGKPYPLEPIGPGLFEFGQVSSGKGIVRFAFTRDASGKVVSLSRLLPSSLSTFPRAP
ncbi:nuclear transport factor 2 family protein [Lysobacter sp. CFH 32150]|uniref:nuclear transport factor 2 family protein n=1 Tax=Lysobacter sp. CFH 32150 TaxID=2927128 RepID=UPI001FA7F5CA|nr:nuclear transport factor 2 family protein [Lysobacter sp. CFH 32150]